MRPKAVVYFEWIIFGTLLLDVLGGYLNWDRIIALAATAHRSAVGFLPELIFDFVLIGTLTLLVSRRRSKIAMWVLIAVFVLGLSIVVQSITHGLYGSVVIVIVALAYIGQALAYGLLFTPSARRWMNRENAKLTPSLDATGARTAGGTV
ncbi:MAG TPA: hypothetical protein VGJ20_11745 [Xanthobacteraceae bacterium]|jgi:hypothetical protein